MGPLNDAVRAPALAGVVEGLADWPTAVPWEVAEPVMEPDAEVTATVLVGFASESVSDPLSDPVPVPVSDAIVVAPDEVALSPPPEDPPLSSVDVGVGEADADTAAALEVAAGEEDEPVPPMLIFLIVNLPEALPLSPKRMRMYVLRVVTDGTVISARPSVIGKPFARGLSRSRCSFCPPSESSKNPRTIIPVLVKPAGMIEVSHVTL